MKNIISLLFMSLLLVGCNSIDQDEFILLDHYEIEYGQFENGCQLVSKVDGEFAYPSENSNKFTHAGYTFFCSDIRSELGNQEISFSYRNTDYIIPIKVIDSTKPVVTIKEENIKIKVNEKFDINNYYSVSDNFDEDVKVSIESDINTKVPGTYNISLIASDSSLNETKETLTLIVEAEEKVEVADKPKSDNNSTPGRDESNSAVVNKDKPTTNEKNTEEDKVKQPTSNKKNKFFSINDFDDFDSVLNACHIYIKGSNGSCLPVKNKDDIYIGYRAEIE